jgi:lysophospholipase L1-like esterase
VLVVLAAVVVLPTTGGAQSAPLNVAVGKYISLGDSFASGEGLPPFEGFTDVRGTNQCHRSPYAYPALIAGQLGLPPRAMSERWACSGATTSSVLRGQWDEGPQYVHVNSATSLVTIMIGGNDIGYASVAAYCVLHPACHLDKSAAVAAATKRLGTILPKIYANLLARAPLARILVVGYPRLFPRQPSRDCSPGAGTFDVSEQRWINGAELFLNRAMVDAVAAQHTRRIRFVNTYDAWNGREMCGGGGTLTKVNFQHIEYSLHPTLLGQRLIADKVLAAARAA